MAVVAPTTAVCAVAIPVLVAVLLGERPVPLAIAGIVLGIVDHLLVSQQQTERTCRAANWSLPSTAATGGGHRVRLRRGYRVLPYLTGSDQERSWNVAAADGSAWFRFSCLQHFAIATRASFRMSKGVAALVCMAGVIDMLANALYLLASRQGQLSVVVTLSSLYPASTVLLARDHPPRAAQHLAGNGRGLRAGRGAADREWRPVKAGRREWIGLAVIALPCLLYSMDLTVLNLAVPAISADLQPSSTQLLWILDIYGFLVASSRSPWAPWETGSGGGVSS